MARKNREKLVIKKRHRKEKSQKEKPIKQKN